MIKVIFFDISGVLCTEALRSAIKKYAEEFFLTEQEVDNIVHKHSGWKDFTLGYISEKEYLDICSQQAGKHTFVPSRFTAFIRQFTKPNKDLIDYIKKDLATKYIIGVISNNPKEWYEFFIDYVDLKKIVSINAISCYLHIRKPDRKIFQIALAKSGVKADEVIYVDDRSERTDGAKEININVITYKNIKDFKKMIKQYEENLLNTKDVLTGKK